MMRQQHLAYPMNGEQQHVPPYGLTWPGRRISTISYTDPGLCAFSKSIRSCYGHFLFFVFCGRIQKGPQRHRASHPAGRKSRLLVQLHHAQPILCIIHIPQPPPDTDGWCTAFRTNLHKRELEYSHSGPMPRRAALQQVSSRAYVSYIRYNHSSTYKLFRCRNPLDCVVGEHYCCCNSPYSDEL